MQFSIIVIPSILAGFLSIYIGYLLWAHRKKQTAQALILLFFSLSVWSFGYALEQMVPGFPGKTIWLKLEFIGVCWITTFWILFCIRYTSRFALTGRQFFSWFSWFPMISIILAFTNEYHNLFWSEHNLTTAFGMIVFENVYGLWFWILISYSYLLYLGGLFLLLQHYLKTQNYFEIKYALSF